MDPISTKVSTQRNGTTKKFTSVRNMKFTKKPHLNNSVIDGSLTSESSANALIKTNGKYSISSCKVPVRQDCRTVKQPLRKFTLKISDNTIKKGNVKSKIVSHIKLKEGVKKDPVKIQSDKKKCGYLTRSYLSSGNIAQHNLYLSTNTSVCMDEKKSKFKLGKLFPNRSYTKGHSQSDTRLDYCPSYGDKNEINSKRKIWDGMPKSKKVKFEILPRGELTANKETNFSNSKKMIKNEDINKPLKPILKHENFRILEEPLIAAFTDEKERKNSYQCKANLVQISNENGEILKQNDINTEENLPSSFSSESFDQSQIMYKSSENLADNVTFNALNASNFKDERHPGSLYTKIKMSEFGTKIKHLQRSRRETFEKEINDKVEILKGTLLKEIEEIKKDISSVEEKSIENPTRNWDNISKEHTSYFKVLELSDINSDSDNNISSGTIQTVNRASDSTRLYFNKSLITPEYTKSTSPMSSRIPRSFHKDVPKDNITNPHQTSPDIKKIKSFHDFSAANCTESTPSTSSQIPCIHYSVVNNSSEKLNKASSIRTIANVCNNKDFISQDNAKNSPRLYSRIPRFTPTHGSTENFEKLNQASADSSHLSCFNANDFHGTESSENVSSSRILQSMHTSKVIRSPQLHINSDVSSKNFETDSGRIISEMACLDKGEYKLPSKLQTEECPTLAKTTESFVGSEERSFRKKTRLLEDKLLESNELLNEKGEGADIIDLLFMNETKTLNQDLCSPHRENSKINNWLDDANFPDFLPNCEDNNGSNAQDESAMYHADMLKSTEEMNELNKNLNLQDRMIHSSRTSLNEDDRQEIQEIAKSILKNRNENRAYVQNHRRAILIIFLLMFFGLLIHLLVYA